MKYFLLLIVATLTFSAASAQNKKITFNDLPSEAINYIDNRSLANDITSVWKNTNDNIYTVIFMMELKSSLITTANGKKLK